MKSTALFEIIYSALSFLCLALKYRKLQEMAPTLQNSVLDEVPTARVLSLTFLIFQLLLISSLFNLI